ncbi:MAG: zinc protease [Gammaproteobacteria bacterium]
MKIGEICVKLSPINGFLSIALSLFSGVVFANVHEYELDNGLKILVKEDHRAPVVVSQVWYKVGSSYEHEGITGISHALEHMMFKGTEKYPAGEFSRIISENGGQENAFTGSDYTAYFQTLESSRLPISMELEADRMRNLIVDEDEFIKEIEVVKEERRWRTEDNPKSFAYEVAMSTAFQTSPYRNPIVGWMSDLDNMTVASLRKWYQQWYAPNNATLVVSGDVNAEEVYQLAKKYFGPLAAGKPVKISQRPEIEQKGVKRITVKRPAELPYMMMAYKVPVLKTAVDQPELIAEWEPYALEVLAGILGGSSSSRFASNLVRGKEIAAGVSAGYNFSARLDHLFTISGTPSNKYTVAQLEAAVQEEIELMKNSLVSESELARIKAQVVSNDVYERDSVFYQAMIIGIFETVGLSWQQAEKYVESIKAVTAEQVQAVAIKYLQEDLLTVAVLEPQPLDGQNRSAASGGFGHGR